MCRIIGIGIGNFFGISIGKIWPILVHSLNIITLLFFSDQLDLHSGLYFLPDRNNFFLRKRLHTLRQEKKQIVKEKMKQRSFFCERIAYCFAQLHIAQHDGKKSLLHHTIV